jgi:hypothetical protein
MKITDSHFDELFENGYVILRNYYPEEQRRAMAEAQRRVLKTWEQVKDNPPPDRSMYVPFPSSEFILNRAMVDHELLNLARRFLKTEQIHIRVGLMLARYPGYRGDSGTAHIDNGNNSLLPKSDSAREFGQLGFWVHLDDVGEDQAPLQLIRTRDGQDMSKVEKLACPGGTVCVFSNYTWHSAGNYTRADGQRFTWGFAAGRADHCWEGFKHYTDMGMNPHFQKLIGSLSAKERELFRFPPAGHPYYTPQTLAALEKQYPGWNRGGEYAVPEEIEAAVAG